MIFVGVDGGGSTCRVRVRDHHGALLAQATGGAANVYLDFEAAVDTIRATVGQALTGLPEAAPQVGLGLAGVSDAAGAERVRLALGDLGQGASRIVVTHDGDIACLGAHAGADGGLIIAGTGSGAVARIGERSITIGGRGFILGDDGSGARLGQEALRAALRVHDGLEAPTPLGRRLMQRFGDDPVAAIAWGRQARSADYAAFAPEVLAAATAGDTLGLRLLATSAAAIADLAAALVRLGAPRLSFVGGLSGALRPYLPQSVQAMLHPPLCDALDGALLLAGCPLPAPGEP